MNKKKITWFIFLLLGFIVLLLNHPINFKFFINFMRELKELLKKHSKYIEDSRWTLIEKPHKKF